MTTATATTPATEMTDEQVAAKFLALFKTQYRGVRSVSILNGCMTVTTTRKSANSLLSIRRDLRLAGFGCFDFDAKDSLAWMNCKK